MIRTFKFVFIFSIYFNLTIFLFANVAHSYIDPGSGSYILQLLIASFLGFITLIGIYWSKVKIFLDNIFTKNTENKTKNDQN